MYGRAYMFRFLHSGPKISSPSFPRKWDRTPLARQLPVSSGGRFQFLAGGASGASRNGGKSLLTEMDAGKYSWMEIARLLRLAISSANLVAVSTERPEAR